MGRSIIAFPFWLLLSSIGSPDSTMFVLRSSTRYSYCLFRVCHLYCFCLFQRSVCALFHARKFGYDVGVHPVSVHTDSEGRGKKLSRVEKEVSDICVAVPFDEKLTILRTTNGVARVKIWIEFSSVRVTTKFSEVNS